jgi:hypothetical protein
VHDLDIKAGVRTGFDTLDLDSLGGFGVGGGVYGFIVEAFLPVLTTATTPLRVRLGSSFLLTSIMKECGEGGPLRPRPVGGPCDLKFGPSKSGGIPSGGPRRRPTRAKTHLPTLRRARCRVSHGRRTVPSTFVSGEQGRRSGARHEPPLHHQSAIPAPPRSRILWFNRLVPSLLQPSVPPGVFATRAA